MYNIYQTLLDSKLQGKKLLSVLIDPDKFDAVNFNKICNNINVDFIMVGGSLITNGDFVECIKTIKKSTNKPVIIFPGNYLQISNEADAILLLSLISGRNPALLIGNHVLAAPSLKKSQLEIISTGYMLIDSGKPTSVSYMSNTTPIPYDKDDIAVATAMAGEQLGLKLIYLEAGSGAKDTVSLNMVKKVSENINVPLIVGGGIKSPEKAIDLCKSGADILVIGNVLEKNIDLLEDISFAVHSFDNKVLLK